MSDTKKPKISEHIRQRTQEWFRKAEHELAYLRIAPYTTCRMAHMVAEYALKAYLMINKHKIPKSHDLVYVLSQCISIHDDSDFELFRSDCQLLTTYRTEMAYPGAFPIVVPVEEAKAAISIATNIYQFVLKKTNELGY